jgi:hypothetical protein
MGSAPRIDGIDRRVDSLDKNLIINGGMDYWQRTTSATVNTASLTTAFTSDRFFHYSEGTTNKNYSVTRNTSVPTAGQIGEKLEFSRRFTCLTAIASFAAGDRVLPHCQTIEGVYSRRLIGKQATLGFWVFCSLAGTYPVSFQTNNVSPRTFMTTFDISAGEINTWVWKSVGVTFETTNMSTTATAGIFIRIGAHSGSNFRTATTNEWVAGNLDCTTTSTNIMSVVNSVFAITGVQLIEGNLQPGWFSLAGGNVDEELRLCQRYFCVFDHAAGAAYPSVAGAWAVTHVSYPIEMRVSPLIVFGTAISQNVSGDDLVDGNNRGFTYRVTQGGTAGNFRRTVIGSTANAEL